MFINKKNYSRLYLKKDSNKKQKEICLLKIFKYYYKLIVIFFLFIIFVDNIFKYITKRINLDNRQKNFKIFFANELLNNTIKNNTILIFEPNIFHHECTPGYTKYFIDLGYNVDLLMFPFGIDSLNLFKEYKNIKIFIFQDLNIIKKNISSIIKKYDFILLQSTSIYEWGIFKKYDFFNANKSFFVFHDLSFVDTLGFSRYLIENRIWTLGNFSKGLQVNPHYFGDIKIKNKNKITTFFLTSSERRNYTDLISSLEKLKEENFKFKLIVVGRSKSFFSRIISQNITKDFIMLYNVNYSQLYYLVESSDYIIIPLDPNSPYDREYNTTKSTGSIQLAYGFLKPPIINEQFSNIYNLNIKNCFLYNSTNFYDIIKKSIIFNNMNYKRLQKNLYECEKEIYKSSINNIKKAFNKIA